MYARLVQCSLPLTGRITMESVAAEIGRAYPDQPGFRSLSFLFNDRLGEYITLSLWDTREQAEAAGALGLPERHQYLVPVLQGPPLIRIYELFQP
jgi:hypothetical protein